VNADDIELMEGKAIYLILSKETCILTRHDFCYSVVSGSAAHGNISVKNPAY